MIIPAAATQCCFLPLLKFRILLHQETLQNWEDEPKQLHTLVPLCDRSKLDMRRPTSSLAATQQQNCCMTPRDHQHSASHPNAAGGFPSHDIMSDYVDCRASAGSVPFYSRTRSSPRWAAEMACACMTPDHHQRGCQASKDCRCVRFTWTGGVSAGSVPLHSWTRPSLQLAAEMTRACGSPPRCAPAAAASSASLAAVPPW